MPGARRARSASSRPQRSTGSSPAGTATDPGAGPSPASPVTTLTPLRRHRPAPPTGELRADLRQSSRDAALGRIEVWIDNGTPDDLRPTRIVYVDPRLRAPIEGQRLRDHPSGAERGFPLPLPARPRCGPGAESDTGPGEARGRVRVTSADGTVTLPVADEARVLARFVAARCTELAVARAVGLSWADRVPVRPAGADPGPDSTAELVLRLRPTGRPGHALRIVAITGTPVLTPVGAAAWRPGLTLRSTDPPRRLRLPVEPARCDPHVFGESGGATAFALSLTSGRRTAEHGPADGVTRSRRRDRVRGRPVRTLRGGTLRGGPSGQAAA